MQVSSTETGAIFGNIVYEGTGAVDRQVVVLNDIHIDIMDYISPASVPDVQFRSMWAEFEWENKVTVLSCHPEKAAEDPSILTTRTTSRSPAYPMCIFASSGLESEWENRVKIREVLSFVAHSSGVCPRHADPLCKF